MADEYKIITFECSNGHSIVTYKYHDGIVPQIMKCRTCGKDAIGVSKKLFIILNLLVYGGNLLNLNMKVLNLVLKDTIVMVD